MTTTEIARLNSPETEQAYLGCILIDGDVLTHTPLMPDDFMTVRNRWIYEAADAIRRRGDPVDYLTVTTELERAGHLAEAGGPAYLMTLINATPSSLNAPAYAEILREKRRRRQLVTIAQRIAQAAYDESQPADTGLGGFISDLASASSMPGGARPISEVLSRLYDEVEARMSDPRDVWGIPTGFRKFDLLTGGMQQGEVMIVAGLPGAGKSILGNDLAAGMAGNEPGAIYSMEMRDLSVMRRLVSGRSGIPTRSLKTGRIREEDFASFVHAIEHFSRLPVHISDSQGWTTTSLRADLARLKAQHGIKWVLLDYMYLLKDGEGKDENTRTLMQSEGLKRIASELDLAVLAIHSLNKSGMGGMGSRGKGEFNADDAGMGSLEDLRGSAQVVYNADLVCFLTKYNVNLFSKPEDKIAAQYQDHARVLWFAKGRELENPKQCVILIQRAGFPKFAEHEPETRRSTLPRPRDVNVPEAA